MVYHVVNLCVMGSIVSKFGILWFLHWCWEWMEYDTHMSIMGYCYFIPISIRILFHNLMVMGWFPWLCILLASMLWNIGLLFKFLVSTYHTWRPKWNRESSRKKDPFCWKTMFWWIDHPIHPSIPCQPPCHQMQDISRWHGILDSPSPPPVLGRIRTSWGGIGGGRG